MDAELRRAWTEIVLADDYEEHMAAIGQAQAAAELTRWLIGSAAPAPGSRQAGSKASRAKEAPHADGIAKRKADSAGLSGIGIGARKGQGVVGTQRNPAIEAADQAAPRH